MIQRIQTIYLLVIAILAIVNLFFPLAVFQQGNELFTFDLIGISAMNGSGEVVYPTWGLFGLMAVIALIALVTIFLFKKRILQIRLCVFNMLLMLGFYAYFAYMAWDIKNEVGADMSIKFALCLELVSLILNYLAIRNIGADEALVRSLERLR